MNERPTEPFILSLLGSLFVLMGATLGYLFVSSNAIFGPPTALVQALTGVGIFLGSTLFIVSLLLYMRPELHVVWGVVILVLSVGSISASFAGFGGFGLGVLGTVMGILGGAFAIAWRPGVGLRGAGAAGNVAYRGCLACGRPIQFSYAFCPACGAPAAPMVNPPARDGPPPGPPR